MIAMWDDKEKRATVLGDTLRTPIKLSTGVYRLEIIFLVEGKPQQEFRQFVVGEKADDLVWIKS